jgi:hypothetical protein
MAQIIFQRGVELRTHARWGEVIHCFNRKNIWVTEMGSVTTFWSPMMVWLLE